MQQIKHRVALVGIFVIFWQYDIKLHGAQDCRTEELNGAQSSRNLGRAELQFLGVNICLTGYQYGEENE